MDGGYPKVAAKDVPWITKDMMVEVDRAMVDDYRIELHQMMENAGRNLAHVARARFGCMYVVVLRVLQVCVVCSKPQW